MYNREALARLYSIFQATKDSTILVTFAAVETSGSALSQEAKELLASSYAGIARLSDAASLAQELLASYRDTASQERALLLLVSLRGFDQSYRDVSRNAFSELVQKYGSTMDRHLLLGLRTQDDVALPQAQSPSSNSVAMDDSSSSGLASYPNPFNPSTQIQFTVRQAGFISLKVFDMLGREVATLVNEVRSPGTYTVNWNANQLATGIYFARFEVVGKVAIQKLLYLK